MTATRSRDIGQLIKSLRGQLEISQEKLAAKLGVTFSTVNRWENGKVQPSPLAIKQIQKLLVDLGPAGQRLHDEFFGK
ncbi:helix-turn-helix protein [Rubripirellula amarantea]|uniref:Helix-turn-helix protein n=1 Tax=Rubripirellula amarantea TaxID=2527999 RepID=A0A5C5WLN3_9BACT|nr:helix-turn-helix transcriptional regulator [Rubripirellula amarantea]TWT50981.1 helix-turn-helix protein [Rubripirellula amarantea]